MKRNPADGTSALQHPTMDLQTGPDALPAWHDLDPVEAVARILLERFADRSQPVLVSVGGPGGTGKTTFCRALAEKLPDAVVLRLDDYKTSRRERTERGVYGPHPEANRLGLIEKHLALLRAGKPIDKPIYCRTSGEGARTERMEPDRFVLLDGEVATFPVLRERVDFSVFIDADLKTQLMARIERDIEERGYDWDKAISTFLHSNLREFREHGAPSKAECDVHLHCREDYSLQVEWISERVAGTSSSRA